MAYMNKPMAVVVALVVIFLCAACAFALVHVGTSTDRETGSAISLRQQKEKVSLRPTAETHARRETLLSVSGQRARKSTQTLSRPIESSKQSTSPTPLTSTPKLPFSWSGRVAVYVLYYNDASRKAAEDLQRRHPLWVRPHALEQSTLLESVMYKSSLPELESEWQDCDFVGTIAAIGGPKKIPFFKHLCAALDAHCERRKPLVDAATDAVWLFPMASSNLGGHPPVMKTVLEDVCTQSGLRPNLVNSLHRNAWNFSNFWLARPVRMREFIDFFSHQWLPRLEAHPQVWSDAKYPNSMFGGAKKHPALIRGGYFHSLGYFPLHPFICERAPSLFAKDRAWKGMTWTWTGSFSSTPA